MRVRTKLKTRNVIPPVEAFKACPRCKDTDLYKFEEDVFCFECEWNSVDLYARTLADAYFRPKPFSYADHSAA